MDEECDFFNAMRDEWDRDTDVAWLLMWRDWGGLCVDDRTRYCSITRLFKIKTRLCAATASILYRVVSPPSREASSALAPFALCSLRPPYPCLWKAPACLHQRRTGVSSRQVQATRRSCSPATPLPLVSGDTPTIHGVSFSSKGPKVIHGEYLPRAVPVEPNWDHAKPRSEK